MNNPEKMTLTPNLIALQNLIDVVAKLGFRTNPRNVNSLYS